MGTERLDIPELLARIREEQKQINHSFVKVKSDPNYYFPQIENLRQAGQHIAKLARLIQNRIEEERFSEHLAYSIATIARDITPNDNPIYIIETLLKESGHNIDKCSEDEKNDAWFIVAVTHKFNHGIIRFAVYATCEQFCVTDYRRYTFEIERKSAS